MEESLRGRPVDSQPIRPQIASSPQGGPMFATRHAGPCIVIVALAALPACAGHHTYGVSVAPTSNYEIATTNYLEALGFARSPYQRGEVWSMERRHGDSVDHIAMVRGGPAPAMTGFTMPGSGGAAYLPGGAGVSQASPSGGYMSGLTGAGQTGLVLEVRTYRIDK